MPQVTKKREKENIRHIRVGIICHRIIGIMRDQKTFQLDLRSQAFDVTYVNNWDIKRMIVEHNSLGHLLLIEVRMASANLLLEMLVLVFHLMNVLSAKIVLDCSVDAMFLS